MNQALTFPPIDATVVRAYPVSPTDLAGPDQVVVFELADTAIFAGGAGLVRYSRTEAGLAELKADLAGKTYDLATSKGDQAARADRLRCVTLRTTLEKRRKAFKEPALAFGKMIDSEAARITKEIEAIEAPIDAQIKADERRRAEEKAEKARIEAERCATHERNTAAIRAYFTRCTGLSAERIATGIELLDAMVIDEDAWAEYAERAVLAKAETLSAMRSLHATTLAAEQEAARIEVQRVEQARVVVEQAERQRALDAERAELERWQDELDAQRAESERLERLAEERRQKELMDRAAAEAFAALEDAKRADSAPPSLLEALGNTVAAIVAGDAIDRAQQTTEGHPATAGPVGVPGHFPQVATPEGDKGPPPDTLMLLRDALAFTKYAAAPFFTGVTSGVALHPKTTPEWWAGLRGQIEALQPLLIEAIAVEEKNITTDHNTTKEI
jgi:hypothetical protein